MIPCERYKQSILDAVDQNDHSILNQEIQEHLDQCKPCLRFYESLVLLKQGLRKLKPVKAPDSFQIVLQERIRREIANKPGIHFKDRRRLLPVHVIAVTAVVIVAGFIYVGQSMIHDNNTRRTLAQAGVYDRAADLVSYVIDDFDVAERSRDRMQISRIDSLLQQNRGNLPYYPIQPVSF